MAALTLDLIKHRGPGKIIWHCLSVLTQINRYSTPASASTQSLWRAPKFLNELFPMITCTQRSTVFSLFSLVKPKIKHSNNIRYWISLKKVIGINTKNTHFTCAEYEHRAYESLLFFNYIFLVKLWKRKLFFNDILIFRDGWVFLLRVLLLLFLKMYVMIILKKPKLISASY